MGHRNSSKIAVTGMVRFKSASSSMYVYTPPLAEQTLCSFPPLPSFTQGRRSEKLFFVDSNSSPKEKRIRQGRRIILVGLLFWLQAILQLKYVHENKRKERFLTENINREEVGRKL